MRILGPIESTFNAVRLSTSANSRSIDRGAMSADDFLRVALLAIAAAATLTISLRDPRAVWMVECASFLTAALAIRRVDRLPLLLCAPLAAIALWGFAQLALGATEDRFATLEAALRMASLAAIAITAAAVFGTPRGIELLAVWLARFGFVIATAGVLVYFTSPGKLLWIFPSPYPDSWGVFLSRNNFAQFLELALPAALYAASRTPEEPQHASRPQNANFEIAGAAVMLAAGIASASRAGSIILIVECAVCLSLLRRSRKRWRWKFGSAAALCVAIAGSSQLIGRFRQPDPLELRREMARSALAMIRDRPLAGFGLGSFAAVYPAYATFDIGATVDHAHNDWLEWTAEGGVGFAAAWMVLAARLIVPAIRTVWGIGVLAVFAHAAVDFPFARMGIAAWVFLLIGAMASPGEEKTGSRESRLLDAPWDTRSNFPVTRR